MLMLNAIAVNVSHELKKNKQSMSSASSCVRFFFLPEPNRNDLVNDGAIPIFIQVLQSCSDNDVHYYCCAALSNLAINEKHRAMMVAVGYHDVIEQMIRLLGSKSERVHKFVHNVLRLRK